jgi:hypothetical protein
MEPYTGTQTQVEGSVFRLDVDGVCRCYNTAAGVGIMGKDADKNEPRKGLPMTIFFALLGLLGLAAFFVPDLISKGVNLTLDRGIKGALSSTNATSVVVSAPSTNTPPNLATNRPRPKIEESDEREPVYISAYVNFGVRGPMITLTDGSMWTVQNGVQASGNWGATILGTNYTWQPYRTIASKMPTQYKSTNQLSLNQPYKLKY